MAELIFKQINPIPKVANLIQQYWVGEVENKDGEKFTHVSIAQSRAQILFHYEGEFEAKNQGGNTEKPLEAGLYGPTLQHQQYYTYSRHAGIFGIQLVPSAIPSLLAIPAQELTNQTIDLIDIWGNKGRELKEKIISAKTDGERAQITSAFFEKRLIPKKNKFRGIEFVIEHIHRRMGEVTIDDLVNISCLSRRQFERNFKEFTGFSAPTYIRIIRFENAINRLDMNEGNLTQLSLACGYYDQAHFNRDFKMFTGLTPNQYFRIHPAS